MKKLLNLISYCLFLISLSVIGQTSNKIPESIINKINSTEIEEIFSVANVVKYDEQILRVNELVFAPNSVLEFTNMNYDWIVIIADKIKFAAPTKRAIIRRSPEVISKRGERGKKGDNGSNGKRSGRHGNIGGSGKSGSSGGNGETLKIPDVYIITEEVIGQHPSDNPDYINLKLIFPGIDGGDGGVGGLGGNGGRGGNGANGVDKVFTCKSGGGDGGNGGTAGKGGKGGNGGDGSNGSNIYLFAKPEAVDILSFSTIINQGGEGGYPGLPGDIGIPGEGGSRGRGSKYCGGGSSGATGRKPNPENLGHGKEGLSGTKGRVFKIVISNLEDLGF